MYDLLIKNGTIVTEETEYNAHIYIKSGKIELITQELIDIEAKEILDASNQFILPGLMDTHIHSRDKGATHKEDFYHSTLAAVSGGITTVFEMPNTNPPVNNVQNFKNQVDNLINKAFCNFGLWGICLGDLNNDDIRGLNEEGVVGFKYFWGYAIDENTYQLIYNYDETMENVIAPYDDGQVYKMFEEVTKTGKVLAVHAENSELINYLGKKPSDDNLNEYDAAVAARPSLAEELTIQTGISFAKELGTNLHVLHISSKEGIELVEKAQKQGLNVTGETCPHFLYLTNEDFEEIGNMMKVYPLVKFKEDKERLWKALTDGTLSLICSDHAPHTEEEKTGEFNQIPAGMCGVETLVPLMLNSVSEGRLTLQNVVSLLSAKPARLFNLYPKKGALQPGADADLTIVDMNREKIIDKDELHSKSKVTAYDGFKVKGLPVSTIVNGKVVMLNEEIIMEPSGQLVKPLT